MAKPDEELSETEAENNEVWGDFLSFHGQEPGEHVTRMVQPHVWTFAAGILESLLFLVIPALAYFWQGFSAPTAYALMIVLPFIVLTIGLRWFSWSNTVAVLTDRRIISVWQKNVFSRSVSETNLENIQNAHFDQKGLTATLLNIGTMTIETSDGSHSMILRQISQPYEVQQDIFKGQRELKKTHNSAVRQRHSEEKKRIEQPVLR